MSSAWKEAHCKDCMFCYGDYCHRFPPTVKVPHAYTECYPRVRVQTKLNTFESFACAEYRPKKEISTKYRPK